MGLNSNGYLTNGIHGVDRFGTWLKVEGRAFTPVAVNRILRNPIYAGQVKLGDERYEGNHKAIIDLETYVTTQKKLASNRKNKSVSTNKLVRHAYLLTNLARCSECGAKMWCERQGSRVYYRAPYSEHSRNCSYNGRRMKAATIDADIDILFREFELRPDWRQWILDNFIRNNDTNEALNRKKALIAEIERVKQMTRVRMYSLEEGERILNRLEVELSGLYIPEFDGVEVAGNILEDFGTHWKTLDIRHRHEILVTMLDAVYVDIENVKVIGLLPKEDFIPVFLAMTERKDIKIHDGRKRSG